MLIEISDQLYKDLMEIAKEYVIQDKRSQAEPCMFTVQSIQWEDCTEDTCDECYWVDIDGNIYNEDEAQIWCDERGYYFDKYDVDILGEKDTENEDIYLEKRYRRWVESFENTNHINPFFTAKYCEIYIHNDKHNLSGKNHRSYSFTPRKNFEMTTIAKLLIELGDKK